MRPQTRSLPRPPGLLFAGLGSASPYGAGLPLAATAWVTYLGWLCMADLGMRLGWSWFGGLWAVGLWWLWQAAPLPTLPRRWHPLVAAATGLALVLASDAGRTPVGWVAGAVTLIGWAELARQLGGSKAINTTHHPGAVLAQGGVLLTVFAAAAWVVVGGLPAGWGTVAVALTLPLAAMLAFAPWRAVRAIHPGLTPTAALHDSHHPTMALMMGTWLAMGQWCAAAGLSAWWALTLHGAAMVAGLVIINRLPRQAPVGLRMALLLGSGTLVTLSDDWRAMLLAVVLLAAGTAGERAPNAISPCPRCTSSTPPLAAHAVGAAALLAVGHALPTLGPSALAMGWWATLAAGLLLALHPNRARP